MTSSSHLPDNEAQANQASQEAMEKLESLDFDLEAWKVPAHLLLSQTFGQYDEKILTIRNLKIDYSSKMLRASNANYQSMKTCKRKGQAVFELAIDELDMTSVSDSELEVILQKDAKQSMREFLKGQKKEHIIDLLIEEVLKT